MLRAGRLRERVTIQTRTLSTNTYGEQTETWVSGDCVPADVVPISAFEAIRGERLETQQRYTVTIRYRSALTVRNRLLWGSKALDIHQVIDRDSRGRVLDLVCSYEADNG